MSKLNVRRRGPVNTDRSLTLRSLRPGETFRFPRSRPGTVYQLLAPSDRWVEEGGLDTGDLRFVYSNLSTGQIFGDTSNHEVVLVDCNVTARDRVRSMRSTRSSRSTSTTVRRTTSRSR